MSTDLLEQFEPLIHHVLLARGVRQADSHYDDYAQELRLYLFKLANKFAGDPLGSDRYAFVAYAKRGLGWHLSRLIQQQITEAHASLPDAFFTSAESSAHSYDQLLRDLFTDFYPTLPDSLQLLFDLLMAGETSSNQLQETLQCSRRTLYYRKSRLKELMKAWLSQ